MFYGVVGLIERQNAGFELFCGLERPQHRIQNLVVKTLPHVKFDNLLSLLLSPDQLQVLQLAVVYEIFPLLLDFAVFLTYQHHEVHKTYLFVVGVDFDGTVEVGAVEGGVGLVFA